MSETEELLRHKVAALVAENLELHQRVDALLRENIRYWEALTDLLIGAQQQSQSHADVIARVSEALRVRKEG